MRPLPRAAAALLLAGASCSTPAARSFDSGQSASVMLGLRHFEDGAAWAPNEDLGQAGVDYLTGPADLPWRWDFGLFYAGDRAERLVGGEPQWLITRQVELRVGGLALLPTFTRGFHPYLGAGTALAWTDSDVRQGAVVLRDEDFGMGGYARAGFWIDLRAPEFLGLDLTVSDGPDADLGGAERPVRAWCLSLVLGAKF